VRREGKQEYHIGRRYGEFVRLHRRLRTEFPGKHLPPLPRKNKSSTTSSWFGSTDDDNESVSSLSTQDASVSDEATSTTGRTLAPESIVRRSVSKSSLRSSKSPRASTEVVSRQTVLYREEQRVSLRAFLRTMLHNKRVAESKAMEEFLTSKPISLNEEELIDVKRRKEMDAVRIEEQKRFYEIARQRAAELDVYMEQFRRDIVESSMFKFLLPKIMRPVLTCYC
jgi:hypothetical protein